VWALKKVVSRVFFPLPLGLEIMLVGLLLLWFTKRQKTGKVVTTFGVLLLALLSSGFVGDRLLGPLEASYLPLLNPADTGAAGVEAPIQWITVLGSGYTPDPKLPASAQPSSETLTRLVEGSRLQRLFPGSKLIFSAGYFDQPGETAKTISSLASLLGIQESNLIVAKGARDTAEEVKLIERIVGREPLVLVTSASHMPRAMALFQAQAMHPIPAPTCYRVRENQASDPSSYFPSADALGKSERAFYEYLGQAWAKLSS
jgi:uncharacterized SAM-binding protein YcdF (DUF218 family)